MIAVTAIVLCAALAAAALASSTNFVEPATSPEPAGGLPGSVIAADLDGDSDQDLALALGLMNEVSILKNNGSGNFKAPASSPEMVGPNPRSVAAADIDGDGDQDLAVAQDQATNNLTILKNNGSGNFTEPSTSPLTVGSGPRSVIALDVDGDSDADLVTANTSDDNVTILKNNGSGRFTEPVTSPVAAGNAPMWVVATDVDGDSDQDVVTANNADGNVTILKNNGSGKFTQPASSPETVGSAPLCVAAADLDGDTDPDLAIARGGNAVTILKNNGSGNFTEPATSPEAVGAAPQAVVAADFDGDSDQDLAAVNANDNNVTVLRNLGTGNFTEPATSPESAGASPRAIAGADLDGDSDQDLAVANAASSNVTILKNH